MDGPVILVDADACPVKAEIEKIATRHDTPVRFVCDGGLRPSRHPLIEVIYVAEGLDAADDRIVELSGPLSIVTTNDLPLADRALAKGARVLGFDGRELTERNIAARLAARNAAEAQRESPTAFVDARAGGGRPFSARDRQDFAVALERLVRALQAAEGSGRGSSRIGR